MFSKTSRVFGDSRERRAYHLVSEFNCRYQRIRRSTFHWGFIESSFDRDTQMEFGLDKCRTQAIRKGHHKPHVGHSIGDFDVQTMTESDSYMYLLILQGAHLRIGDFNNARSGKHLATNTYYYDQIHYPNSGVKLVNLFCDIGSRGVVDVAARIPCIRLLIGSIAD